MQRVHIVLILDMYDPDAWLSLWSRSAKINFVDALVAWSVQSETRNVTPITLSY